MAVTRRKFIYFSVYIGAGVAALTALDPTLLLSAQEHAFMLCF